jgi:hypothetical protein
VSRARDPGGGAGITGRLDAFQTKQERALDGRSIPVLLWTSEDPGFKAIGEMLVRWRAEDEANDH